MIAGSSFKLRVRPYCFIRTPRRRQYWDVASSPGFNQQPQVLNGASDLLVEIFGEKGIHARLALGAIELPLNAAVELELIVEVES